MQKSRFSFFILHFSLCILIVGQAAAQTGPGLPWTYSAFDTVTGLALPPNGTYVAAHGAGLALLGPDGSVVRSLPVGLIQRFAAAPDGSLLATAAGLDATLRGPAFDPLATYRATAVVEAVAVGAGGGQTAIGTRDGTLTLLDREGRPVTGQKMDGPVAALGFSDGGALAVSIPGALLFLDGRLRETWRFPVSETSALAVSGDGSRVAVGDPDGRIRAVDRRGAVTFDRTLDPPRKVEALAISTNGSLLLAAAGSEVVAFRSDGALLWRQAFFQPVEALALSRDGARAAAALRGGTVFGLDTGFLEKPTPPVAAPAGANRTPAPSAAPSPAANLSTPAPAAPPAPLLASLLAGAGAAGGAAALLVLLHRRGLILLPDRMRPGKGFRALSRKFVALKRARGPGGRVPARPRPRPPKPKAAPPPRPLPRTPPLPPGVARLLREKAREEKTLENLDYMKGRGLLEEGRHGALREEAVGRLKEVRRKLEEAGYR